MTDLSDNNDISTSESDQNIANAVKVGLSIYFVPYSLCDNVTCTVA